MFYGPQSWIKTPQTSDSSFSLKFPASSFTPLPVSVILNTQALQGFLLSLEESVLKQLTGKYVPSLGVIYCHLGTWIELKTYNTLEKTSKICKQCEESVQ